MRKPTGLKRRGQIWHIKKTVRIGDRRVELSGSTGCTDLEAAAVVLEQRIAAARHELLYGRPGGGRSFREAAVEYVLDLRRRGKSSARTERDLAALDPYIGALPLRDICQDAMEPFYAAKRGQWKSGSVKRATRTTVAVLNLAARVLREDGEPWLPRAVPKLVAPDWHDAREPRPITWGEQDRLFARLSRHARPVALWLVHTGCREQEALGLQWTMEIQVAGAPEGAFWHLPSEGTKSGAARILVAPAAARAVLAERDRSQPLVFTSPRGGGRWDRLMNSGWRSARAAVGLPDVRVHDLRHTYGKRLEAAGVPWEHRQALLGHALRSVTELYSGPGLRALLESAERVTRAVEILRPDLAAGQSRDSGIRLKRRRG